MIEQGYSLADWIIWAFCAKSFLLGALRSEQFDRFRKGGLAAVTFYRDNRDASGCLHPIRESEYREPVLADCCEQLQPSEEC